MPEAKGAPSGGANVMSSDRKDQPAGAGETTMPGGKDPEMKNIPTGSPTLNSRYKATDGQTSGMSGD